MTLRRAIPIAGSLAVLGLLLSSSIQADDYDKKTTITFKEPIAIPPVHLQGWSVLPPGTYVFKLANSASNRHIVQIFNKDQTQIYATILSIPNYRLETKDKTVLTFNEGIGGRPESIRAWFYPGANWGEEFVYPKAKAVQLAKVTKLPVLAATVEVPEEVAKIDTPSAIAQLTQLPVVAIRPTGEVVELAQVVQTAPTAAKQVNAAPAQAAQPAAATPAEPVAPKKLPDTASYMPLVALLGLLSLGGAAGVRALARIKR